MTNKTIRKFKKCNNCKYPNCSTNYCCDICFESDFEKDAILMVYEKKLDEIVEFAKKIYVANDGQVALREKQFLELIIRLKEGAK